MYINQIYQKNNNFFYLFQVHIQNLKLEITTNVSSSQISKHHSVRLKHVNFNLSNSNSKYHQFY